MADIISILSSDEEEDLPRKTEQKRKRSTVKSEVIIIADEEEIHSTKKLKLDEISEDAPVNNNVKKCNTLCEITITPIFSSVDVINIDDELANMAETKVTTDMNQVIDSDVKVNGDDTITDEHNITYGENVKDADVSNHEIGYGEENISQVILDSDDDDNSDQMKSICSNQNKDDKQKETLPIALKNSCNKKTLDVIKDECNVANDNVITDVAVSSNGIKDLGEEKVPEIVLDSDDDEATKEEQELERLGQREDDDVIKDECNVANDNVITDVAVSSNGIKDLGEEKVPEIVLDSDDDEAIKEQQELERLGQSEDDKSKESEKVVHTKNREQIKEMNEGIIEFLQSCKKCITSANTLRLFEQKLTDFKKTYLRASVYVETDEFADLVKSYQKKLEERPEKAVTYFQDVFLQLKDNKDCYTDKEAIINKLSLVLEKVVAEIKRLEALEVDFEEEDNSNYVKMQAYKERAVKIELKMRRIETGNPNVSLMQYSRLDFARSRYRELNIALSKKFQDRTKITFPTFDQVHRCIRRCAEKQELKMTENEMHAEARFCFRELGNLIQRKRKQDLAKSHFEYLDNLTNDPADSDPELAKKLQANHEIGKNAVANVIERFVRIQESGSNAAVSSDSEDSNIESAQSSDDEDS